MNDNAVLSDAKRYELMIIIDSDIGQEAIDLRLKNVREMITSSPGEIFHEEIWGLRDLAYQIRKHKQGYYAIFDFVIEPDKIKEMNATFILEPEVVRHLIMVLPTTYQPKDYTLTPEEELAEKEMRKNPRKEMEMRNERRTIDKAAEKPAQVEKKSEETTKPAGTTEDPKIQNILENPDLNF